MSQLSDRTLRRLHLKTECVAAAQTRPSHLKHSFKRGRRMQPVLFIEQPAIRRCWWWFDLFFSKDNYGGNSSWICFWMQVRGFKSLKHPTVQCWQKQRTPILSWLLDNRSSVSCLKGRAEESWWCRFPTDWTIPSNNARFSLLTVWRPRIHWLHPSKDAAN